MTLGHPHSVGFAAWLPDRHSTVLVAIASVGFTAFWLAVFFGFGSTASPSELGFWVYVGGAIPFGTAYGCFLASGVLFASAMIKLINTKSKFWLPLPRALRVSAALFGCHVLVVGLLALLGMWKQNWPWFFGLAPYLWQ